MDSSVIVILQIQKRKFQTDLEVSLDITANDFAVAINAAYDLGVDTSNIRNCYLKSENPIALLKGNKTLAEFGIRNGSVITITE